MTLFITSSPYVDGAHRPILDPVNGFVDRLKAVLPPNPRALFICSHPEARDLTCHWGADTVSAFAYANMAFRSYAILDGFNAEEAANLIHNSDIIFLAGGHVPTQNAFFQEIGLRELLEDFSGVVMGISAGSMNMADMVYVQPEEPGESAPEFQRFAPGLRLTNVNILPHYQKAKEYMIDGKRLYEDVTFADSMGHEFFMLPDNSYFYQDNQGLLLCGKAYRLKDGIVEQLTADEDVLDTVLLD
jgi:dipeptidase E